MKLERVVEVIGLLADGFNPETGEVLPDHHVLHERDCVVALSVARYILSLNLKDDRSREKALVAAKPSRHVEGTTPNAGAPWTEEADEELKKLFLAGRGAAHLATHFKRTTGAIRSRLKKLDLIPSD